jgi:poly-gamma-glutamate synthesis protein (capsule biosynthesis protein)
MAASLLAACCAGDAPASEPRIELALGGDVMLGRLVGEILGDLGPRYVWGDVLPLIRGADLALVNLECVIATSGERFVPRRVFYFRAPPAGLDALLVAGIDYVSLANNHAMDFRAPALLETIRRLDEGGIAHAGAGRNRTEAARFAMLEARGIKVAVVAFADHPRKYAAGESEPGTNVIAVRAEGNDFSRVVESLREARAAGADLVVFSIHWGPNMRTEPTPRFVEFAHAVMDAGADVFHGHSAHVFQGIEVYRGKPILFDTGDLVDDYAVRPELRNDQQLLFLLRATRGGVHEIEVVPLRIGERRVDRARGEDFEQIRHRLRRLSAAMGSRVELRDDRLYVSKDSPRAGPDAPPQ